MNITNEQMLTLIKDEKYDWQGTRNGDTTEMYQSRQCERISYILKLCSNVLSGEHELSINQLDELHQGVLTIGSNKHPLTSGNDGISFGLIANLIKNIRHTIYTEKNY